ncbi:MAG: hypothetical protein JO021_10645 [Alphaproteobacteria bacterium]|nr:hypothetical protein [Alphaproteobacteria bacterium]
MTGDPTRPREFAFGPFRLLPDQQLLLENDLPVRLGNRARDLLVALLERPGEILTASNGSSGGGYRTTTRAVTILAPRGMQTRNSGGRSRINHRVTNGPLEVVSLTVS